MGRRSPLTSIGELLNALMNLLSTLKRAFYFITPLMPGVTKVTQSDPGSNVNSVPQEEHQRQRMRLELWFNSISSPLQSCSGTMSL